MTLVVARDVKQQQTIFQTISLKFYFKTNLKQKPLRNGIGHVFGFIHSNSFGSEFHVILRYILYYILDILCISYIIYIIHAIHMICSIYILYTYHTIGAGELAQLVRGWGK